VPLNKPRNRLPVIHSHYNITVYVDETVVKICLVLAANYHC